MPSALPFDHYGGQMADSKFGKVNLDYFKKRSEHREQIIQTVAQTGDAGSHRLLTSPYAIYEMPSQGIPDSTSSPIAGITDLSILRAKLERTKEERKKIIEQSRQPKDHTEYQKPMMPMEQQSNSDYQPLLQSHKVP